MIPDVELIPSERSVRKTRVAAYLRVSSTMESQEGSYENQAAYYEQKIKSNPEWEFVGIYGDQLSGTHAANRDAFQKLIQDAMNKKIDLILCKSVSRWSRNILDGLDAINLLTGNGIHIFFEEQGIDTRTPGVLLSLNIAQSVAQSESESISENLKWTYKNKAKQGKFWAVHGKYYGYDSKGDVFIENKDAEHVRFMFKRFIDGASLKRIAEELNVMGCRTNRGNEWDSENVRNTLRNEVYVGDVIFHKTPSRNIITGEIDSDWKPKYVKDHHKGIVDRETWDRVQNKLGPKKKRRKRKERIRIVAMKGSHSEKTE